MVAAAIMIMMIIVMVVMIVVVIIKLDFIIEPDSPVPTRANPNHRLFFWNGFDLNLNFNIGVRVAD